MYEYRTDVNYNYKPPKFPKTFAQLSVMELRVLLGKPSSCCFSPNHKGIHGTLDMVILCTWGGRPVIKKSWQNIILTFRKLYLIDTLKLTVKHKTGKYMGWTWVWVWSIPWFISRFPSCVVVITIYNTFKFNIYCYCKTKGTGFS